MDEHSSKFRKSKNHSSALQYPQQFFEPIISKNLLNIIQNNGNQEENTKKEDEVEEKMVFFQYRGRVSEKFEESLKKLKVPCKVIFTLKKLKMNLPSWKFPGEKCRLVYRIYCS